MLKVYVLRPSRCIYAPIPYPRHSIFENSRCDLHRPEQPEMRPSLVYPGAVKRVVAAVKWRDRHILVYESSGGDVIIMEDTVLLQVFESFDTSNSLCASMHPESGNLSICSGTTLAIYVAEELYGGLPTWRPIPASLESIQFPVLNWSSVSWIGAVHLCVAAASGDVFILNIDTWQVIWRQSLGTTRVVGRPQTQCFVAYNTELPSNVFLVSIESLLAGSPWPKIQVLETGPNKIFDAWFATSQLVAAKTSTTTFIWNCANGQLVISAANDGLTVLPSGSDQEESLLLSYSATNFKVSVIGEDAIQEEVPDLKIDPILSSSDVHIASERLYAWSHHTLRIYGLSSKGLEALGRVSGTFPCFGSCVCCGEATLVANRSLFTDFVAPVSLEKTEDDSFIIQSVILHNSKVALLVKDRKSTTSLRLYEGPKIKASAIIEKHPLSMFKETDHVGVISTDGTLARYSAATLELVNKKNLALEPLKIAACNSNMILAAASDKVYVVRTDSPDKKEEIPITAAAGGRSIYHLSISANSMCAVAFSENASSYLELWDATNTPKRLKVFSFASESVISTSWSQDSSFLAVLTSERLLVFAQLFTLRASFVEVSESAKSHSALLNNKTQSSLCWSADMRQLYVFNGKQLTALTADLDKTSLKVLSDFAIDQKSVKDLTELRAQLSQPLPIYHPAVLLLFLASLHLSHVVHILKKLAKHIKFSESSEDGQIALLDATLNMNTFEGVEHDELDGDVFEQVTQALEGRRLAGLTAQDQDRLKTLVQVLAMSRSLDDHAACAAVEASISEHESRFRWWVYGWFSRTQPELRNLLRASKAHSKSLSVWADRESLADEVEQKAKMEFATSRDPTSVTLYYLALRKINVLLTLWRISTGHPEYNKTIKLLNQDFSTTRWRNAAQKNAYALLSKHRPGYAAAFFLLSDSVVDCCKVLIDKLNDMELAVAVTRLYDGDSGAGIQFLQSRYFNMGANPETQSPWLQLWGSCLRSPGRKEALDDFINQFPTDISVIFLFAEQGGQFDDEQKQAWIEKYRKSGVNELVIATLITPLVPVAQASQRADSSTEFNSGATPDTDYADQKRFEERKMPTNLKPAPIEIQLEPDMSAFGF